METKYYCDNCNTRRKVIILKDIINKPVKNGLRVQTDQHRCEEGRMKVYNLFIDDDFNTRTVEQLEIPEFKKQNRSVLNNLPSPKKLTEDIGKLEILQVTNLTSHAGIRMVLTDALSKYRLNIGNVNTAEEEPLFTRYSDLSTIQFDYYPSSITPNRQTKNWFSKFINIIERIPTIYLAEYVYSLRFIQGLCTIEPKDEDLWLLEMLLSSSDITLQIKSEYDPEMFLRKSGGNQFKGKTLTSLFKMLSVIENNPNISLKKLSTEYENDMIYLCNKLLILERLDQIEINQVEMFDLNELVVS